jgi:ribonuclease VapC
MIIDTSALITGEDDAANLERVLDQAPIRRISAANYVEAGIVMDGRGDPVLSRPLDELITSARIAVEPVTAEHADVARRAYRDFGKVSGHPARLNFGDCFAYALAITVDEELLFKGDDFIHTDVRPAWRPRSD